PHQSRRLSGNATATTTATATATILVALARPPLLALPTEHAAKHRLGLLEERCAPLALTLILLAGPPSARREARREWVRLLVLPLLLLLLLRRRRADARRTLFASRWAAGRSGGSVGVGVVRSWAGLLDTFRLVICK